MSRRVEIRSEAHTAAQQHRDAVSEAGKILVTRVGGIFGVFLIKETRLLAARILGGELGSGAASADGSTGNLQVLSNGGIVIGRVRDTAKELGALFVSFSPSEVGFLKDNQVPEEFRGKLRQGDLIPVMLHAQPQRGKRASLTAKIDWENLAEGEGLSVKAAHLSAFSVLDLGEDPVLRGIRDIAKPEEYTEIVVDGALPDGDQLLGRLKASQPQPVRLYTDPAFALSGLYSLQTKLEEALADRVYLKSGASLIFGATEALTVIDVNTGKFTPPKGTDRESAYRKVNLEAAREIALQLRLRNLSGMILVDFINLKSEEDRKELLSEMKNAVRTDPVQVRVIDITKLGILEMTRQKKLPSLKEQIRPFSQAMDSNSALES